MTTDGLDAGELTFRRVHHASPELLFDCMTQPDHLTHFWGPTGTTTPRDRIVVDLRVGGVFETVMVNTSDNTEYTMRATYVEIDRPLKLVWMEAQSAMVTTITFNDLNDGRTEVVTHQTNVPEHYRRAEASAGFQTSLDRFEIYTASLNTGDN